MSSAQPILLRHCVYNGIPCGYIYRYLNSYKNNTPIIDTCDTADPAVTSGTN